MIKCLWKDMVEKRSTSKSAGVTAIAYNVQRISCGEERIRVDLLKNASANVHYCFLYPTDFLYKALELYIEQGAFAE